MRILHVTPYYAPAFAYGGVVSAVTGLAQAQAALGHQVTVLTTDADSPSHRCLLLAETIGNVKVVRCRNVSNTIRARLNFSQPVGFRGTYRRLSAQADVIHAHELRTAENLLMSSLPRVMPFVLSPHGTLPYGTGRGGFKRSWDRLFGRRLLRLFDHVAALTVSEADDLAAFCRSLGVALPPTSIIPNGVDAEFVEFSPPSNAAALRKEFGLGDSPIVLFLGRLHERKGLQFLIPAFAQAVWDQPDLATARLLIVGPDEGMLAAARRLSVRCGLEDRIAFTGLLTADRKRSALAIADVFALPAVGEGLSMAVLEAMAAGLPAVLTPGCNLPELDARGAGITVERSVAPLAEALRLLLRDRERARDMGERGRAWVRQSFTWPAIAAQTIAMYEGVIQAYRKSPC